MRVVGTLAFALAVLVGPTLCFDSEPVHVGSTLFVRKLNVHPEEKMFYKKPFGPLYNLKPLIGRYSFLERDGYIIGWGYDKEPVRAMYGENGKPFIMGPFSFDRQYREEWQMAGYCIGMPMPPYSSGNSHEL